MIQKVRLSWCLTTKIQREVQLFTRKRLDQANAGWTCRRLFPTLGGFVMEKIEGLSITTDGKKFVSTDNDGVDDSLVKRFSGQSARTIKNVFFIRIWRGPKEKNFGCASPIQVIRNRCQEDCQDRILRSPFPKKDSSAQESL